VPYGLIYSARTVCIVHCLNVNHVCITVCKELNDDDDDDDDNNNLIIRKVEDKFNVH